MCDNLINHTTINTPKVGPYSDISIDTQKKIDTFINIKTSFEPIADVKKNFFNFIIKSFKIQEKHSINLKDLEVNTKGTEEDPVTIADKLVEQKFRDMFSQITPNYTIAGEEGEIEVISDSKCLIIDPIDGTSWYTKGIAKYGTVVGMYINGYNILSIVLNTKQKKVYYADLEGQCIYNIINKNGTFTLEEEPENIEESKNIEKNNIYLHLNFKGNNKHKNNEIKEKLELAIGDYNEENNTNYKIVFMQTSVDLGVRVGKKQVGGFIHYGPAPHDIAGNFIYKIHNKELNFTNHNGKEYNYFDHKELMNSYTEYFKNIDTNGKEFLYKYPIIMTNNKNLHKKLLNVLSEYTDIFNEKAKITI